MSRRAYGQFCGLARAIELVGERWALLIVRDLLVRPRRFTDLHHGLAHIPTNILAARLRELERAGVVERVINPRPAGGVIYELTEYGRELQAPVAALARWGARSLGEPRSEEVVTEDLLVFALRTTFDAARVGALRTCFELRIGDVVVHARIGDGCLEAAPGSLPDADLLIEAGPAMRRLMAGEETVDEAIRSGSVRCSGDVGVFKRLVDAFRIGSEPAAGGPPGEVTIPATRARLPSLARGA